MQGLAFPSISRQPFLPPFFTMLQQNLLAAPQFSVWLNPDPDSQDAGEVIFGGLDPTAYTGSLQTVPLSRDRWDARISPNSMPCSLFMCMA